jgi:hypothetical protein
MRGRDWQSELHRYIVFYGDGGTGPRNCERQLEVGDELRVGDRRYEVERVEQGSALGSLGRAWVKPID